MSNINWRLKILRLVNFSSGILIFTFCIFNYAHAHKVNIYAYPENGKIFSESYFVDGTKCKDALIEVVDAKSGEKLLEGKTDNKGKFSFKIPTATSLKLILHASMGHQNDYTLSEEEVREAMGWLSKPEEPEDNQKSEVRNRDMESTSQGPNSRPLTTTSSVSSSEIEAIVGRAIDKKLQPVIRMLVKLQENTAKPGITEVIGGIGYIIGLVGIAMYFKRRRVK